MELIDFFAYLLVAAKVLLLTVGIGFLLLGIDDLLIDIVFVLRSLYRRSFLAGRYRKVGEQELNAKPEQPIAVMIPAWDESGVIRAMLENTLRSLRYEDYTLFVGVYPNDHATLREVDAVCAASPRVRRVLVGRPGPTSKADCLNAIYRRIRESEERTGIRHQIFVMQDCEDVIHPYCYKLFNYLIPRKDMIQLPVEALQSAWYQPTAGHYLDEFAQSHYKDMVVREVLGGGLPAAGVGAAFSRRAMEALAAAHAGEPFSTDTLTEDYELGYRLHHAKLKQVFVRFRLQRTVVQAPGAGGGVRQATRTEIVGVREYFPEKLGQAVRQKSRWVLGIALQGWAQLGWHGGLVTRYMLYRDRKALAGNLLNVMGYVVVAFMLALIVAEWLAPDEMLFPSMVEEGTLLWYVLLLNLLLFSERLAMRAFCVLRVHGLMQALLSLPRMVWGNVINFLATCRALRLYAGHVFRGQRLQWDKTQHRFPDQQALSAYSRRLGEILLDMRLITAAQLAQALERQKTDRRPLGELLREMGCVSPQALSDALSVR